MLKKIIATLILLPAIIYLSKAGVIDFMRLEPCTYMDAVLSGKVPLDTTELRKSRERLILIHKLGTNNPSIPEYLGLNYYILAQLSIYGSQFQVDSLNAAAQYFDEAIQMRPNVARLWVDRMLAGNFLIEVAPIVGFSQNQISREIIEVRHAIMRANVLNPWDPFVLQSLARGSRLRYTDLSVDEKLVADGIIKRAKESELSF